MSAASDPYREASMLFRLAGHPLRLHLLVMLSQGESDERTLQLSDPEMSTQTIRSQLTALCAGVAVVRRRVGRCWSYRLTPRGRRLLQAYLALSAMPEQPATLSFSKARRV